ncbi:hypothetical protein OAA09_00370 [bacterium]|nr:hypothetical protein [bacterium]
MIYCFDIDGTICSLTDGNYSDAKPFKERIKLVNRLHKSGNKIVYFTARGSTTGIDWRALTESQLQEWGAKYHELHLGKPHYDVYVGDKALSDKSYFADMTKEENNEHK